jgi:hypothetical protein
VHDRRRIEQYVLGDLDFRFTQQMAGLGDVLQEVHGQ